MMEMNTFFLFKQKTAYEMVSCDWSSDVCSSDLFAVISITGFTDSRAPVASRRGKHRWHPAPVLPPSIFRCFRETHVASPSTHQLGHRRLRQLHAQHIGASRPTALRRHRRECGWKACRSVDREGAKLVDVSRRRPMSRNARVPRPAGE